MKKLFILSIVLLSIITVNAQWVNDPSQNTLLASGGADYSEIILSTNPRTGNTFMQWCGFYPNGWSPSIQKVDSLGNPQWGTNGIHIDGQDFASYSNGVAMVALPDGGVVSGFANYNGECIAVKIDEDGNFAWGSDGIVALNAENCIRTELAAGREGNFWILSFNDQSMYLRYYHSDGTPAGNQITISDDNGKNIVFGQMVLDDEDNVFVVYMKQQYAYSYYQYKSICVEKFSTDGSQMTREEELMSTVAISGQICHNACPDGLGGGYAWISHPAYNNLFEVYLFHFDSNGQSTIFDTTGLIVSEVDYYNFHNMPSASLNPVSHDLLMAFVEVDAVTQTYNNIHVNRITPNGTKLWGNAGITIVPTTTTNIASVMIDAFPDGTGASVIYKLNDNSIQAVGIDTLGTVVWDTVLSTGSGNRIALCDAATGFHNNQNIIAWEGTRNNVFGMYGQNLKIEPVIDDEDDDDDGDDGDDEDDDDVAVENFKINPITIYQSGDVLHINGEDIQRAMLVNLMGQPVGTNSSTGHDISVSNLPKGIYIVRILTANGKTTNRKVIIK